MVITLGQQYNVGEKSCGTSNAGTGIGGNISSVAWGKGEESESVLSENTGMAAAVLSPGGVFINENKKVVDINHFHISLAYAHSSVSKATVPQHDIQLVGSWLHVRGVLWRRESVRRPRSAPRSGQRLHLTWFTSTPQGRSRNHWEARATSSCSWTALLASSARTGPGTRAHRLSWCGAAVRRRHGSSTGIPDG